MQEGPKHRNADVATALELNHNINMWPMGKGGPLPQKIKV